MNDLENLPLTTILLIWYSYNSVYPRIFWTLILVVSWQIFPFWGFAYVSLIVFLIHIFTGYFKEKQLEDEKERNTQSKILEAIRKNNKVNR